MLISNKTIGVIGGGQLAKLMALEGRRLGLEFKFWAQEDQLPITGLGKRFNSSVCTLDEFCHQVDAVVIDYEHIPLEEIKIIEHFAPYTGCAQLLRIGRDRLNEKKLQETLGLHLNPYIEVNSHQDIQKARNELGFPFILKKRHHSYDGIGQILIKGEAEFKRVLENSDVLEHYMAEKFVCFEKEYSLISVRGKQGEFCAYDLCENVHENGILTVSKNVKNENVYAQALAINKAIAEHSNYIGVFAVEYFDTDNGLLINEISPRVHNSGHWTLDGTMCSQFENHLRACLGLPIGSTKSHSQIKMFNVIGDFKSSQKLIEFPGARIYDYNKTQRPNRKLGHINIHVGMLETEEEHALLKNTGQKGS